ncbi:MAG: ABC transporter ATP-binding protein [Gammaproteobacteria bacterium]|nr:ABC transporter ATP-binding protein [Gammaproteobacteria bacterium]
MDSYSDEYAEDGFDDEALAAQVRTDLWRKLFAYARRYPRELAGLAACAFISACMEVCYPLITKAVVDRVAAHGMQADLTPWILAYAGCTVVIAIAIGTFIRLGGKIRTHVSHDIRRDGFENLQRLSFSFYDQRPVGWLMARMTSDCERLSNILAWGFLDLVWGSTMMLGIALAMLVMNPKLAVVVLAILPVLAWVSATFQRRILKSARRVRATNSRITASYNEAIMGVLTSKAFVREKPNLNEFSTLTDTMHGASVLNMTQAAIYVPIVITLASLSTGLALAVGGFDLLGGAISAGTLVAFMAYTRHFFDPVEELGQWFAEMQMAQASAERIISLIEAQPEVMDRADTADPDNSDIRRIELRDVSFAYDPARPVLQNIDLIVHRGETIAIVGPTGGGKSTLVNLICRFYEPTRGQVLIDGIDYRSRSLHWLQSNLGMVLQSAHVFSGSIIDNIRYGRLEASDEEVYRAARMAGAHEFVEQMEHGYATQVGEGGGRLSAGQKQLISFARAILADPQILVMDEATSSVDTETEQRIQRGLANVLKGRIAFVIAHRLSTIRHAHRIIVVESGRIIESGSHGELMAARGHYYELYRQQSLQESTVAPPLVPAPG